MSSRAQSSQKSKKPHYYNYFNLTNKRFTRLNMLSQFSQDEMNNLLSSMTQISKSMTNQSNISNTVLMKIISANANKTTEKLIQSIQSNQRLLQVYDRGDQELKMKRPQSKRSNAIRLMKNESMPKKEEVSLDNISIIPIDLDEEYQKNHQLLMKLSKLNQLKGQIMLNDQKKKYSLNRKFEGSGLSYVNFLRTEVYDGNNKKKKLKINHNEVTERLLTEKKKKSTKPKYIHYNQTTTTQRDKKNSIIKLKLNLSKSPNIDNALQIHKYPSKCLNQAQIITVNKPNMDKINNICSEACNNNNNILFRKKKRPSHSYSIDQHFILPSKPKVDINLVNKEFNFNPKSKMFQSIREEDLIIKNAKNIKNLDKRSKSVLNQLVRQMLYENYKSNNDYVSDSLFNQQMNMRKRKEQFKKVSNQTGRLEKYIMKHIYFDKKTKDNIEEKELKEIVNEMLIDEANLDKQSLIEDLKIKHRVMKNIKPIITNAIQQKISFLGKYHKRCNTMS